MPLGLAVDVADLDLAPARARRVALPKVLPPRRRRQAARHLVVVPVLVVIVIVVLVHAFPGSGALADARHRLELGRDSRR